MKNIFKKNISYKNKKRLENKKPLSWKSGINYELRITKFIG